MASLPIPVFGNGFFLEKPHLPVNGDCVLKYHYFFQECDQGKAVWDFSHAIPKGESHYMQWINLGDSVFVKIENGMQSNFRIQNDTLYWAGYENPLLRVEDSIAPIMAIKSSSKHNSITSAYHFKGMYCGNNYVGLIGHFAITTGGKGLLILPDDTLSDVMPVLITNKFSVKVSNTPQIDNMVSPPDNLLHITDSTTLWYSPDYRYPIVENLTRHYYSQGKLIKKNCQTYMCTPSEQEQAQTYTNTPQRIHKIKTGQNSNRTILPLTERTEIDFDGTTVNVEVKCQETTTVSVLLCDIQGHVWSHQTMVPGERICKTTINTAMLPSGIYLVYVACDGESYVKRIKKD